MDCRQERRQCCHRTDDTIPFPLRTSKQSCSVQAEDIWQECEFRFAQIFVGKIHRAMHWTQEIAEGEIPIGAGFAASAEVVPLLS